MEYRAKQGDIIWITLDPQSGHEQKGRSPAIVISNNTFNCFSKTAAMLCPITNTDKGIPIQIKLDDRTKTSGIIMCDQAKILDLIKRNAVFIERAPDDIVFEVADTISGFLEIENETTIKA
jgi:mRNA interferase MazF